MRDRAVETMIQTAQSCAPGGTGTKHDAVSTVRMCMELLELMKLVGHLRNYIIAIKYTKRDLGHRESSTTDVATIFDSNLRTIRTQGFQES